MKQRNKYLFLEKIGKLLGKLTKIKGERTELINTEMKRKTLHQILRKSRKP